MPVTGLWGVVFLMVLGSGSSTPNVVQWQVQALEQWIKTVNASQRLRGWEPPWDCINMPGFQCDPRGRIITFNTNSQSEVNLQRLAPSILPTLAKLSYLTFLSFSYQVDTIGGIPTSIGNLINLRYLIVTKNPIEGSSHVRFQGTIPASLGRLSSLVHLDLSSSEFRCSIPDTLGNLSSVTWMNLWGNQFQGSLPASLGRLSTLAYLSLKANEISGSIPGTLGNLRNITEIDLSRNKIQGSLPASLGSLSSLVHLDLSYNRIGGSVPGTLGSLRSLTSISLRNNKIEGSLPATLSGMCSLVNLDLSYNNAISGSIPGTLGHLTGITSISLRNNMIEGSLPATLSGISSLVELDLSFNTISGSIPHTLGSLTGVSVIKLRRNKIEGSLPATLGRISSLYTMDLCYNAISGSIPSTFGNLTGLTSISLSNNQLEGSLPVMLSRMSSLVALNLSYNAVSGSIPGALGSLTDVTSISLRKNQIEGSLPASLSRMSALCTLDLGYNTISGSIASILMNLPNLVYVDLTFNHIQGSLPSNLGRLSSLIELRLCENKISGSLPASLGALCFLHSLQLSYNLLRGSLPDSLSRLLSLTSLSLSHNRFNGSIPNAFGNLTGLLELDLSYNSLTGEVTNVKLPPTLQVLNVSGNALTGDIEKIAGLMDLSVLGLLGNKFGNFTDAMELLKPRVRLARLSLSSTQDGDIIPDFISLFSSLSFLRLQADRLSGEFPQQWSPLKQLTTLIIEGEGLSGSLPESLATLPNLKQFQVPDTVMCPRRPCKDPSVARAGQVCNRCAAFCASCPSISAVLNNVRAVQALLQFQNQDQENQGFWPCLLALWTEGAMDGIEIRGNDVVGILRSDTQPERCELDFTSLQMFGSTLTSLILTGYLSTSFPSSLGELTSLQVLELHVSFGELTSLSPLSRLTSLTRLQASIKTCAGGPDLSSLLQAFNLSFVTVKCRGWFEGEPTPIPRELFNLRHLQYLDLSGDKTVQGPIPQSIGKVTSLSYLDLRGAQLGPVPGELATIPLEYLYMDEGMYSCPPPPMANACPPHVYRDLPFCASYCKEYCKDCPAFNPPPPPPSPPLSPTPPPPSPPVPPAPLYPQGIERGAVIAIAVCGALVFLTFVVVSYSVVRTHRQNMEVEDGLETRGTRRFSYQEIVTVTRGFDTIIVGDESSTVFYGRLSSGEGVAVKKRTIEKGSHDLEKLNSEVKLLSSLHHRSLVALLGYCRHTSHTFLVYEIMELGSLRDLLESRAQMFFWKNRLKVAEGVALAMDYLHSRITPPIVHGAISSKTILVNAGYEGKLSAWSNTFRVVCGVEQGYADPGARTQEGMTAKSDVYSFGIVLLELITELPAWDKFGHILRKVVEAAGSADAMGPSLKTELGACERATTKEGGEIETGHEENHSCSQESVKALLSLACRCCILDPLERPDMFHVAGELGEIREGPEKKEKTAKKEELDFPQYKGPLDWKPWSLSMFSGNVTRQPSGKCTSFEITS